MFESGLDNELLTLDTGLENSAMAAENSTAPQGNPYHQYTLGEDGNWYRGDERVYYWVPPAETDSIIGGGSETQGIGQDLGGYYTEAEIKAAYDADSVLGEQTGGWDNYWGFVSERQAEIQAGNLVDPIQADFAGQAATYAAENTDADAEIANTGRDEEIYYAQSDANEQTAFLNQMAGWVDQNAALMNKYGISGAYQNDDGDVYAFNGSTYSRTYKAEGVDWGQVFAGVMIGAFTGLVGAEVASILNGMTGYLGAPIGGKAGAVINAVTGAVTPAGAAIGGGGAGYEAVANGAFNPNVIVNLADAGGSTSGGPDMTPPKEDTNDDGTRTYGPNLPPGYIYNDARGVVIHEETGKEYPVEYTLYGSEGSPYNWIVNLPVDDGGGGGDSDNSSQNTNSPTATPTGTPISTGAGGENPGGTYEGTVLTNGAYGDIRIDDRPEIWGEGGEYAGWILVSNTGVWGESGISVIYNPGTGFYQEIDWDEGTYDQQMKDTDQENPNPFDTSGDGDDAEGEDGDDRNQTPEPQPSEGDQCQLQDGSAGVIEGGVCVPSNSIVSVNPSVWGNPADPNSPTNDGDDASTDPSNTNNENETVTDAATPGPETGTGPGVITVGPSVWGTGIGGGTSGGGSGEGSGNGSGNGNGDGSGDGNGDGDGDGTGAGAGRIAVGSPSKTSWTRLPKGREFVSRKGQFGKPTGTSRELNTPTYTAARKNLLFNLWDDLA